MKTSNIPLPKRRRTMTTTATITKNRRKMTAMLTKMDNNTMAFRIKPSTKRDPNMRRRRKSLFPKHHHHHHDHDHHQQLNSSLILKSHSPTATETAATETTTTTETTCNLHYSHYQTVSKAKATKLKNYSEKSKSTHKRRRRTMLLLWTIFVAVLLALVFVLLPTATFVASAETTTIDYDTEDDLPLTGHYLAGGGDGGNHNNNSNNDTRSNNTSSSSCTCNDSSYTKIQSHCRNRDEFYHHHHHDNNIEDGNNIETKHRRRKLRERECGARIFYFVGIHNNRTLHDAVPLFRAIRDPRNTILFHIDVKYGLKEYETSTLRQEIEECPCGATVDVVSIYDAAWGTWSMLSPTLWSMEQAVVKHSGRWDVFINLSGDTLPVYTQDRIADLFAGPLKDINFITSEACETGLRPTPISIFPKHWHKRSHYSHQPAKLEYVDDDGVKHRDVSIETYFGSQWMALTPSMCEWFVQQLRRPDSLPSQFRDYLVRTGKLMSDETFIPTMIMKFFPHTVPNETDDFSLDTDEVKMFSIRYERMDEHVPSAFGYFPTEQRYEVPNSTGIEQSRPWGPYFLGTYDLDNIRRSGALFIRKVSQLIDSNIYRILPVDHPDEIPQIGWPTEVKLSPVPMKWDKIIAEYKAQASKDQKTSDNEEM